MNPNLPPGVTNADIEEAFGDPKPTADEIYERECEKADRYHDQRVDRECEE